MKARAAVSHYQIELTNPTHSNGCHIRHQVAKETALVADVEAVTER